ncbi:MAG: 2-phospho-L-lactate guanylyltransferase [Halodesulfurarchaeum sp.]
MRAVIPFDARDPKRRLRPVLDPGERAAFARAMLRDVLDAIAETDLEPTVLATEPIPSLPAPVRVDERPLDAVVNDAIDEGTPLAVIMADLPLVDPGTLDRLQATAGDVVLAPGRGGGTNAMLVRDSGFAADYHGTSIRDHRAIARDRGLSVGEADSFRLGVDVDEPADLIEVLLHGGEHSRAWLAEVGFRIETPDGRATVSRDGENERRPSR